MREGILAAASYSGQRTDELRQNIDEQNRLKTGVLVNGSVDFTSTTNADLSGFAWVIDYQIFQQTAVESIPVDAPDADFPRSDIFVGLDDGSIEYRAGTVDEEGNAQDPNYDPLTEVLLRAVTRNPDNSNDESPTQEGGTDFVSKSAPGNQTIQSDLAIAPLAGSFRDSLYPDANGKISKIRGDFHGVYSTVEGVGATDWSKLVTIDVSGGQLRYFVMLEFAGVSTAYEKGMVWIQFTTDGSGDLTDNRLKVFGEIDPAKLKMVKLDADTYAVFVSHAEAGAFFKFRPQFSFGSSSVYTYHHQDGRNPLPAGDQYEFEEYGGGTSLDPDILDGLEASLGDSPGTGNKYITVSALNSYAYVQEAPNDGKAYVRKSNVWAQLSPYDLKQEGASDGQVLTWSSANSRYEPMTPSGGGGSSKWTDITNGIYRGGPVGIAANNAIPLTSLELNVALSLKGYNTGSNYQLLKGYNNSDEEVFALGNSGNIKASANFFSFGDPVVSDHYVFKGRGQLAGTTLLTVYNSADGIPFQVLGQGVKVTNFEMSGSQLFIGNPASPTAGSFSYKSTVSNGRIFATENGAGVVRFEVLGSGAFLLNGGVFRLNNPSSPTAQIAFRGQGNLTSTSNYEFQNGNGSKFLEFFGGGRICMYMLPSSDPLRTGELWNDSGTVKISAG